MEITPADIMWDSALHAFDTLDAVQYMHEAVTCIIAPRHPLSATVTRAFKNTTFICNNWLHEISPLRLTTLNSHRASMINVMPSEKRHLFPWYELLSHINNDTLETIARNYKALLSDSEDIPPALAANRLLLKKEINKDPGLSKNLHVRHTLHLAFQLPPTENNAFTLCRLAQKALDTTLVPNDIVHKGLVRTATRFIDMQLQQAIESCENIMELAFLMAFCAPTLKYDDRLSLLRHVHAILNNTKPSRTPRGILRTLGAWFQRMESDQHITKAAFDSWFARLATTAASLAPADYDENGRGLQHLRLHILHILNNHIAYGG
jgi:hypothetical protein